jgi:C-3',4' desaturase CrtD
MFGTGHEVIVVGGGIGGLTAAALLAARGVDVCLLERESRVGGCAANFEKFGYSFEGGTGLYAGWQSDEIHDRVFAELPVSAPKVSKLDPSYVVRLPEGNQIAVSSDTEQFEAELRRVFPECADKAVQFYRSTAPLSRSLKRAFLKVPDLQTANTVSKLSAFQFTEALAFKKLAMDQVSQHLSETSSRFRRFLDLQLNALAQTTTAESAYLHAAMVLNTPRDALFAIHGGGSALADALARSIQESGGKIRLDTPVLRLRQDSTGAAQGVDLLSGESIEATKAVISNLTVWDTFGKLVGLSNTPSDVRREVDSLTASGSYLIFAGLEEVAAQRLPATRVLILSDWQDDQDYDPTVSQLSFSVTSQTDTRAPSGGRAATIIAVTDVSDWFTFHEDESVHETHDQSMLEVTWARLHNLIPELGTSIEVIETATPLTYYESTRRKLGLVGNVHQICIPRPPRILSHMTPIQNLLRVGDTAFPGAGLASVTQSALIAANALTS